MPVPLCSSLLAQTKWPDLISIGPMLQGMHKPVNGLSRGALVDDIVYTIALTAIQGAQTPH